MRKWWWLSIGILLVLFLAVGGAYAQEDQKVVGLVVRFPDGQVYTEVVAVPADATVADVLEQSTLPVTLTTTAWGPALCSIRDVGCPAEDCFCDPNNFWAFYIQQDGSWVPAPVGVGSYTPADKEVVGFAWSGFDANYNPTVQPPFLTFTQIAGPFEIPEPTTLALIGTGAAALAGYVRRRQRA